MDSSGVTIADMEVVPGMTMDPALVPQMRAHLQQMARMTGDSMVAMREQHRRMVTNMLALMVQENQDMGMAVDTAWTAAHDSVRRDLTGMTAMSASEMEAIMPDHTRRVDRLIASHEQMMAEMGH